MIKNEQIASSPRPYVCVERTLERCIVRGHARGRKSLLEPSPNSMTIEREHLRQHPDRLIHRVNDGAGDAVVDDFRNRTMAESEDRRARGGTLSMSGAICAILTLLHSRGPASDNVAQGLSGV